MLSGNILPVHPIIKKDELFSSWLVRLAMGNSIKQQTFMKLILPGFEIWNRDINRCPNIELLKLLAQKTGQRLDTIIQSTLQSYEGILFERFINGHTPWIMPVKVYHRTHLSYGLVYCPLCLQEDTIPYFRKHWRLSFSVICEKHHIKLKDRCPQCEAVIDFHRNDFKDRNYFTKASITECHNCGFDLRKTIPEKEENDLLIQLMSFFHTVSRQGYIQIDGIPIYSLLIFHVFHQLFKLLTLDKYGIKLRSFVENEIKLPIDKNDYNNYKVCEILPIQTRRHALILSAWLFKEWPIRFVEACQKTHLTKSRVTKDMKNIPYWFNKVLGVCADNNFLTTVRTERMVRKIATHLEYRRNSNCTIE